MFKNWEYVVLSQVQTLSGLYLVKPIDMEKSFKPSEELRSYIDSARKKRKICWTKANLKCRNLTGTKMNIIYLKSLVLYKSNTGSRIQGIK